MSAKVSSVSLGLVLALSVIVRIAVFLLFPPIFAFDQTGVAHGSVTYDVYAQNLLASGVYGHTAPGVPDAHLPPLYSTVLAGLYALFGRAALSVALAHIVLDALSIALLYFLCSSLFPHGQAVGLLAGLFYALYPYLIFQNLTLIDTPLFMTLLYAFLALLVLLREAERLPWATAIVAGMVCGLLALTRANALILLPLAGLWFLFRRSVGQTLARLAVVIVAGAVTIAPWVVRNYQLFGAFVPFALNGGENFYQGNNPYTVPYLKAGYDAQWVPIAALGVEDPFGPEANVARMNLGLEYLRQHPEAIPDLLWTKFVVYWSIDVAPRRNPVEGELPRLDYEGDALAGTDPSGEIALGGVPGGDPVTAYSSDLFDQLGRTIHRLYFGALLALGIAGSILSLRAWRDVSLLWFALLGMTVVYVVFHPSTRYRAPTDPLLFAFSAYTLVWLVQRVRQRGGTRAAYTALQNSNA